MLIRLLFLFTVVPIVELLLLMWIGQYLGFLHTITLILLTGIAGTSLARYEGLRTLHRIRTDLGRGMMPAEGLVQGAMILVAGALLVAPGVLTDAVGLCMLIPPARRFFARYLIHYLRNRMHVTHMADGGAYRRHVDARVTRVEDQDSQ